MIDKRIRYKSKEQKRATYNIETLYKEKNSVIKISGDFSAIKSAAKYEAINGEGIKISTSKQVLQKLSIAFPLLKADNTSKN